MKIVNIFNTKSALFLAIISSIVFSYSSFVGALGPIQSLLKIDGVNELVSTFEEKIEKQLKILQENKEEIKSPSIYKEKLETLSNEINKVKDSIKALAGKPDPFLQEKLSILSQQYQVVSELEQLSAQVIDTINDHMRLLCEYRKDPTFSSKHLRLETKALYSFEEAQKLHNLILDFENELKELEEKQKKIVSDLANRKKAFTLTQQEHADKKKQQEGFVEKASTDSQGLTSQQQAELIDEQEELLDYKEQLAALRVREIEQRSNFVESQIATHKIQLEVLKDEYDHIKRLVKVDEQELQRTQNAVEQKRQETARVQREHKEKIGSLLANQDASEERLKELYREYNVIEAIRSKYEKWSFEPQSSQEWAQLVNIGKISNRIALNAIKKQFLEAQIELNKAQLREEEVRGLIMSTWYKLTSRKTELDKQEDVSQELKQYETLKTEIQTDLSTVADKKTAISTALNNNAKMLDHLKERLNALKEAKDQIFKTNPGAYAQVFSRLKDAEEELRRRSDVISKLNESYNTVSNLLTTTLEKVEGILSELKSKAQWVGVARPFWKGLQSFLPDIKRFVNDLNTVLVFAKNTFTPEALKSTVNYYTDNIYELIVFGLKIIIACILFILVKLYLPDFSKLIQTVGTQYGFGNKILSFVAATLNFFKIHLFGLFIWFAALIAVRQGVFNPYINILFYLFSIPYMLFYANRFISYIRRLNKENNYFYINEEYHRRFFIVLSLLLYSTIIILLFRQAFVLGNYSKSDVPTVLLAFNFFILQLSTVLLISREQILSLIPRTSMMWQTIYSFIDDYYYLFLLVALIIIFVSNPYVGFGPQIFSIVSRIILIALLIPLFSTLHTYVKRSSFSLFFKTRGEITKERFSAAKTYYGLFMIVSFLFFIIVGVIIGANILGYSVGYYEMYEWLNTKLFDSGAFTPTGRPIPVTPLSLFKVVLFVILGMVVAYLINRFILRRMFELLLVNIGIQSALMSLTRYIIIFAFLIIGLQAAGLSSTSMILYLLAIIGGIGFAAKDFITDVLSYFVILVQRPLKIGDFVKLGEDIIGVVRHITLRSIVIRKKNSVTIIIPNSYIVNHPIINWNYSPTFFAFNDIHLKIPYSADPDKVKSLLLKILDNNINILESPAPIVWLSDFVENGFQFTIRGFLSPDRVLDMWEINSQVRFEIARIMRENSITFACPTRTIVIPESLEKFKKDLLKDNPELS